MYFNKYGNNDTNREELSDYDESEITETKTEIYNESLILPVQD